MKRARLKKFDNGSLNEIPSGCKIVREYYDDLTETYWLIVENDKWPTAFEWQPDQDRLPLKFDSTDDLRRRIAEISNLKSLSDLMRKRSKSERGLS